MKTQDIKNIASAYMQVLGEKKMDKVDPDELKGTHAQRKDKDIDNDGDIDASDEYLHNRRKAVKKAMTKEEVAEAAPKMKGDSFKQEREKGRAHDAAMGRTATGRKKPQRAMTSTQRSLASLRNEGVEINEAENKAVTAKVTKRDRDAIHIGSHGDEHVYLGGQPDRDTDVYHVHNTQNNTTRSVVLDHGGKRMTHAKVRSAAHRSISPGAVKVIHQAHSDDIQEGTNMSESRWPILQRIMERQNHGNMDNGSPAGEGLSPSAKAELDKMKQAASTPAVDGMQAAMDTIQNAAAGVKTAAKRPGDQATGDKTMPSNDGK